MPPELSGAKSSRAAETVRPKTFFVLQALKEILPDVIVQGIPSVNRAVINVQEPDSSRPGKDERYCDMCSGETVILLLCFIFICLIHTYIILNSIRFVIFCYFLQNWEVLYHMDRRVPPFLLPSCKCTNLSPLFFTYIFF